MYTYDSLWAANVALIFPADPEAQNDNEPDCFQSLMDKVSPGTMDTVKDAKNSSPPEFVTKMCSVVCGLGKSAWI